MSNSPYVPFHSIDLSILSQSSVSLISHCSSKKDNKQFQVTHHHKLWHVKLPLLQFIDLNIKLLSHQQTTHTTFTSPFPAGKGHFPSRNTELPTPSLPSRWGASQARTLGGLLTWKAAALKVRVTSLPAGPPLNWGGCTGQRGGYRSAGLWAWGALALIGAWEEVEAEWRAGCHQISTHWHQPHISALWSLRRRGMCRRTGWPQWYRYFHLHRVGQAGISPLYSLPTGKVTKVALPTEMGVQPIHYLPPNRWRKRRPCVEKSKYSRQEAISGPSPGFIGQEHSQAL